MAEIEQHVRALREGDDAAKLAAARALSDLTCYLPRSVLDANKVAIAEAGGIPPLVELLRDGSAEAKRQAVRALGSLAYNNNANDANQALIAEAGGIPPLVELMRDGSAEAKSMAAWALHNLAWDSHWQWDNADNQVLIAAAVGFDALVELARRGRVTVDNRSAVFGTRVPSKRKAALVVAALLRDFVPKSVPRDIKGLIGTYL